MKGEFKGNATGYQVVHWVRCVHEGARDIKIHITHNILISGKLRNMAAPFPGDAGYLLILLSL